MYGHKKSDRVEEQNDRIMAEWITPITVAVVTSVLVSWLMSK